MPVKKSGWLIKVSFLQKKLFKARRHSQKMPEYKEYERTATFIKETNKFLNEFENWLLLDEAERIIEAYQKQKTI
jgi:hypothetical protein